MNTALRILLTNDDGIASPGINLLAKALRAAGRRVFVIAPSSDRSGVSHSISFLSGPCKLIELEPDTWSCSGTPADCVVVGLLGGIPELQTIAAEGSGESRSPPDLIISGINRGANLGTDLVYSGTAAAARQGSLFGIPSIALSLVEGDVWHWDMAVSFAAERLGEILAFWKTDTFVNVNIPNTAEGPSGLIPAFPSLRRYHDRLEVYKAPDGHRYCFSNGGKVDARPDPGSDWDAVSRNGAALSAICVHPQLLPQSPC
ncbi:MAG: 5'/3'-nucleotidase SurE [Treponema sp.]|jgi:5'-nucleotidase|nr:5'/3'-nucleotidase SurE [Treponema sp.]